MGEGGPACLFSCIPLFYILSRTLPRATIYEYPPQLERFGEATSVPYLLSALPLQIVSDLGGMTPKDPTKSGDDGVQERAVTPKARKETIPDGKNGKKLSWQEFRRRYSIGIETGRRT